MRPATPRIWRTSRVHASPTSFAGASQTAPSRHASSESSNRSDTAHSASRFAPRAARLEQRSPLARLSAGYGYISSRDGKAVLSAEAVKRGDFLNIRLKDGKIEAEALRVLPDPK